MILVTFAVPFESAAFRQRVTSRAVRIVHTGVGADAARATLEEAVGAEAPTRVITSGFAGALIPDIPIGGIVSDGTCIFARRVRIASAPAVLATVAAKRAFRERTGAEVVDMETDAIRAVCATAGLPLTALRAISDGAEDDLGLPPVLLEKLSRQPVRALPGLAWTLLADAGRRRAFLRLMRDCRKAQAALADALDREISMRPL
ncbi:MAG: hypothetical protein PHC88_15180 [Terrimicrobiaceae bacterium]|nr:hypothetical protein [Terrimicrobiaceae bacterium]